MPEPQMTALSLHMTARPRCPKCQSRTEIRHTNAARSGFEHWTLRCPQCGLIHETQVNTDPMTSDAQGWAHSNLMPPS
jgi:uncharacterized Zn finger protein